MYIDCTITLQDFSFDILKRARKVQGEVVIMWLIYGHFLGLEPHIRTRGAPEQAFRGCRFCNPPSHQEMRLSRGKNAVDSDWSCRTGLPASFKMIGKIQRTATRFTYSKNRYLYGVQQEELQAF
jgi:hypothetical protein